MLSSIHIENIALIETLDLELGRGFSVLTGETGAGKSIIIDAIGLILGARGESDLVRNGAENAVVEAMFTELSDITCKKLSEFGVSPDEDGCLFIRRTLTAAGRSTARIGSRNVPVSLLRDISGFLVNIHGQHHNSELLDPESYLSIIDSYGECTDALAAYEKKFSEYSEIKRELSKINTDTKEKARRAEMLEYQIKDIKSAKLKSNEETDLFDEKRRLKNYEKIAVGAGTVYSKLYGDGSSAAESMDKALASLKTLIGVLPEAEELYDKLYDYRYEIEDIAERVKDAAGDVSDDPEAALDRVEERLEVISKLKSKYGGSINEVLEYLEKCEKELSELETSEERTADLEKRMSECEKRISEAAETLSKRRKDAAEKLSESICAELKYLDMGGVRFTVEFSECGYKADGSDEVEFYISTNPGEPGKPVGKIASGGELARIMLAIKSVLSDKDSVETMIYDEVDTGVSGKTSRKIGERLLSSSSGKQVLCVTHSAQIASLADTHYLVSKKTENGRTRTSIYPLSGEERIEETARILAGINITDAARNSARELIDCGR